MFLTDFVPCCNVTRRDWNNPVLIHFARIVLLTEDRVLRAA
jgi:hypothetical protein